MLVIFYTSSLQPHYVTEEAAFDTGQPMNNALLKNKEILLSPTEPASTAILLMLFMLLLLLL